MQCTTTLWLLFASTSSQRYSTSLANIKLNICCSILLPKSRLNVKLKINKRHNGTCFQTVLNDPSRSSKVTDFGTDFLLVLNSNLGPILPRFRDNRAFIRRKPLISIPQPYSGQFLRCWSRSMMLGSAKSEHPRLTNGEIIFEEFTWWRYLNITDGRQTTCCSNTALYIKSQGKK